MGKYQMVVLAKAADGRLEDLAHWYDNRHLPDLLKTPGFVSGVRYGVKVMGMPAGSPGWDFLVVYELDTEDPLATMAEAGRRLGTPRMPRDSSLDSSCTIALIAHPQASQASSGWEA